MYTLQSLVVHIGDSLEQGHYIAYVKRDNKWYKMDDHHAQRVAFDEVCACAHHLDACRHRCESY